MTAYIELAVGWLFPNGPEGRQAKAFTTRPPFKDHPEPTINITSPDCGEYGSTLGANYMFGVKEWHPALKWDGVDGVKQWVLVDEDLDVPLPSPVFHGGYLGISPEKREVDHHDFELAEEGQKGTLLKGGFYYCSNLRSKIWVPPKPLLNHGMHRYEFTIIALNEPLDPDFIASRPGRDQVAEAIQGKVLGWGKWMGRCERRWD